MEEFSYTGASGKVYKIRKNRTAYQELALYRAYWIIDELIKNPPDTKLTGHIGVAKDWIQTMLEDLDIPVSEKLLNRATLDATILESLKDKGFKTWGDVVVPNPLEVAKDLYKAGNVGLTHYNVGNVPSVMFCGNGDRVFYSWPHPSWGDANFLTDVSSNTGRRWRNFSMDTELNSSNLVWRYKRGALWLATNNTVPAAVSTKKTPHCKECGKRGTLPKDCDPRPSLSLFNRLRSRVIAGTASKDELQELVVREELVALEHSNGNYTATCIHGYTDMHEAWTELVTCPTCGGDPRNKVLATAYEIVTPLTIVSADGTVTSPLLTVNPSILPVRKDIFSSYWIRYGFEDTFSNK